MKVLTKNLIYNSAAVCSKYEFQYVDAVSQTSGQCNEFRGHIWDLDIRRFSSYFNALIPSFCYPQWMPILTTGQQ